MPFARNYKIGARALMPMLRTAPSDMFDLMQEVATIHSDELGYTMDYFMQEQKGWALINWMAVFERLPKWRENVTVETWATSYSKLVATRNFRIYDEAGNDIVRVLSKWVLMDKVRRRPIKPSDEMIAAYFNQKEDVFTAESKIIMPTEDEAQKIGGSNFIVRRSHTDSNMHVNNIKYIIWAEDDLPDDVFWNQNIKCVYVNYKKEARIGTQIVTSAYKTHENEYANFIKDTDGTTFAEVLMTYR